MNWNDYEAVWKRQELPVGANADLANLRATFETKRRKLAAAIQVRDFAEGSAGVLVAAAFAFIWWQQGKTGWPIGMALALVLGVTTVFIRERLRARRNRLGADASLLAKVEADISELKHQRHLILTLWWWYFSPVIMATIIVGATITRSRPPWDIARDPLFHLGFGIFYVLICWFGWAMNRHALRKQLEPRLAELEKLHRDLMQLPIEPLVTAGR